MRARVRGSLGALREVARNPGLRRLQLAWFGANVGHDAYFVAISVYAFEAGGPAAVGIAAVLRMLPSALATPFAAVLADRHSRRRVMLLADLSRAVALALATLAVALGGSLPLVIALATLAGLAYTPFEAARAALLPSLARTPEELTAANVASSGTESVATLIGSAAAGVAIALAGPAEALALAVLCQLWSALFVARIPPDAAPGEHERDAEPGRWAEVAAGLHAVRGDRRLGLIVALVAATTFSFGASSVLVVVLAVDALGSGEAGVGYLNAALGAGALVGAVAALGLVGSRWLGRGLGLGVALWGAPLALAGLTGSVPLALALFATIGLANTLVDTTYLTLLQRLAPARVLARVFGLLELTMLLAVALGNLAAPLLIDLAGERAAFLLCGGLLPLLALLAYPALRRIDAGAPAPGPALALLERVPMFAPLGAVALERLAGGAATVRFPAGAAIVTQGDPGERFYVIAAGEVEVRVDGRPIVVQGAGSHFGEIALLRATPRTATVTALTAVEALSLGRDEFVAAVRGHAASSATAEGVIGSRLARAAPAASG